MSILLDAVKEGTATTGTGNVTLSGALPGYTAFSDHDGIVNGSLVYYVIEDGNNREIGVGTWTTGGVLERTTVLSTLVSGVFNDTTATAMSLSGSAVVFSAMQKKAIDDLPGTGFKDMLAPISTAGVPSSSAPTPASFGPSGKRESLAFAVNDYCFLQPFHCNHDIKPGGLAYLHVHWSTNGTSTATVKWEMEVMRAKGHNQEAFGAPITKSVEQAASGTAWQHMVTEVGIADALTMTEPDELILVTLTRVTNGGTDNTDTIFGLMCDLHYESDRESTVNKAPDFYS